MMPETSEPTAKDILSPQEIAAVRHMQEVYGGLAKQAATEFSTEIAAKPEFTDQLIGYLALALSKLDFERRRAVAIRFRELAFLLSGRPASEPNEPIGPLELRLVSPSLSEAGVALPSLPENAGGVEPNRDDFVLSSGEAGAKQNERVVLKNAQIAWLGKLYDEEAVARIAGFTNREMSTFIDLLCEHYIGLKITKLGPEAKQKRAAQLKKLLSGISTSQIATEENLIYRTLWGGLNKMSDSIKTRTTQEVLLGFIERARLVERDADEQVTDPPTAENDDGSGVHDSSPDDEPPEPPAEDDDDETEDSQPINPLATNAHKHFFGHLFGGESFGTIEALNLDQLDELTERLARYVRSSIPRIGRAGVDMRIAIMGDLMHGKTLEEIAEERQLPLDKVRDQLRKTREGLAGHLPEENRQKILAEVAAKRQVEALSHDYTRS